MPTNFLVDPSQSLTHDISTTATFTYTFESYVLKDGICSPIVSYSMGGLETFMEWNNVIDNPTLKLNLATSGITTLTTYSMSFGVTELGINEAFVLTIFDCSTQDGAAFEVEAAGMAQDSEGKRDDSFDWNVSLKTSYYLDLFNLESDTHNCGNLNAPTISIDDPAYATYSSY